jgi:hypothetical protein
MYEAVDKIVKACDACVCGIRGYVDGLVRCSTGTGLHVFMTCCRIPSSASGHLLDVVQVSREITARHRPDFDRVTVPDRQTEGGRGVCVCDLHDGRGASRKLAVRRTAGGSMECNVFRPVVSGLGR